MSRSTETSARHNIPPVFDETSEILILGSFPSVKSREEAFFYAHPRNRFWTVLAAVFQEETPQTVAQKKELLRRRHVALWDVLSACDVSGSADASIRNAVPNDIGIILRAVQIEKIFLNGQTAASYYKKWIAPAVTVPAVILPSTSPANAAFRTEDLIRIWREQILPAERKI